jgi:selenocysteine lyase/cysteine desulfurase
MVIESLDWREGEAVLLDPDEYPSVLAPAALHRHPRIALRFARMDDPEAVAAAIAEGGVRMIAVSHVSYLTGRRYDLAALRRAADAAGAILVVDHTQAAGYLPIPGDLADFAFAATYKWLLGMTGTAVAYWNRARQPGWRPASAGWHSLAAGTARPDWAAGEVPALVPDAMRFARGNPAHAALYVLDSAQQFLGGFEAAAVQRHVQGLTVALLERLRRRGIPTTTPEDPARHGASVCIAHPRAAALAEALQSRGVWAWNGRGRVRFSFHGYNAMDDVTRIDGALGESWQG